MAENQQNKKSRLIFGFLFDLVFPKYCLNCGVIGSWLCSSCAKNKLNLWLSEVKLEGCDAIDRIFYIANFHEPLIAKIVKTCKYQGVRELARLMGRELALELQRDVKMDDVDILPVPLHKIKLRARGFNQADEMATQFIELLGGSKINAIKRKYNEKAQAQLSRMERLNNLESTFYLDSKASFSGNLIIVIDDVVTTGTTMNEIAKILKKAGVKEVWGLAFAHGS